MRYWAYLEGEDPGLAEVGHDADGDGEESGGVVGEPLQADLGAH